MSEIKNGGAGDIQLVPENTPIDVFENAIRTIGVVAACEWFGYAPDSDFTRIAIAMLIIKAGRKKAPDKVRHVTIA